MNLLKSYYEQHRTTCIGFATLFVTTITFTIFTWYSTWDIPFPYSFGVLAQFLVNIVAFKEDNEL